MAAVAAARGPYPAFVPLGSPAAYANYYLHVPVAIASYAMYTGALASAVLYLLRRKPLYDGLVRGFVVVGTVYAAYTLASGSIWASESWGAPWNWDPRQTGVLLLFIAYLVYFALRASIADPDRAPVVSAVYAVAAYAMVPVSYLAAVIVESLHPTGVVMPGPGRGQELRGFAREPVVMALFATRLALVMAAGALAARLLAGARLGPRAAKALMAAGAAAAAILAASAAYMAAGYAEGTVARVYAAHVEPGRGLVLTVGLGGAPMNVTYAGPYEAFLVNGTPALAGHVVSLRLEDGVATELRVLRPPVVIANTLLYGAAVFGLTLIVARRAA